MVEEFFDYGNWDLMPWESKEIPSDDDENPKPFMEQEIIITWQEGIPWDEEAKRVSD